MFQLLDVPWVRASDELLMNPIWSPNRRDHFAQFATIQSGCGFWGVFGHSVDLKRPTDDGRRRELIVGGGGEEGSGPTWLSIRGHV